MTRILNTIATVSVTILFLVWLLTFLSSCSRETSFECRSCETEVTVIRNGSQVGVARYEVACDTAKVGEQIIHGPTVTWVYKTECR